MSNYIYTYTLDQFIDNVRLNLDKRIYAEKKLIDRLWVSDFSSITLVPECKGFVASFMQGCKFVDVEFVSEGDTYLVSKLYEDDAPILINLEADDYIILTDELDKVVGINSNVFVETKPVKLKSIKLVRKPEDGEPGNE